MTPTNEFPLLLSPLAVGPHVLRNRVIMGSMHTRLEHGPESIARLTAFYLERARGGAALIVTGGHSPNAEGALDEDGPVFDRPGQARAHRELTSPVRETGALIALQILHAGRYGRHGQIVAPSAIRAPIQRLTPRELTGADIDRTLDDFARCASLAREAGYDGVELMGSEGYLVNQFTAARTNQRGDGWGGDFDRRSRFATELVRRVRRATGPDFLVMFRISALELVDGGADGEEILALARAIEAAGADILNTGIGWHEAPIPTIAYMVPRGAWRGAPARIRGSVRIPVVASNRINTPALAEALLAEGAADLVSLARPFLADAQFVNKAAAGDAASIVPCIACNQACLDQIFDGRVASCLVNPRAGQETSYPVARPRNGGSVAVVGAGPAGLACAIAAAERGARVTLFDAAAEIGGQLNLARRIPGKEEFDELLRHFRHRLARLPIRFEPGRPVVAAEIAAGGFEQVVVATGVVPRRPTIEGIDHPCVADYVAILTGRVVAGQRVLVLGSGGIGHDVAEFLTAGTDPTSRDGFLREWGVDPAFTTRGGLRAAPADAPPLRSVTMLQRSPGRAGRALGRTTGWIVRSRLARRGVVNVTGCTYRRIDDAGLHVSVEGSERVLPADTVVICAGQESENSLATALQAMGVPVRTIGGALLAGELDAQRAIDEGSRAGLEL